MCCFSHGVFVSNNLINNYLEIKESSMDDCKSANFFCGVKFIE